jgi:hypothetical protein
MWVLWALCGISLLAWVLPLLELWRASGKGLILSRVSPDGPEPLPRLSIVVPALNEEETVEQAMRTLLALDYPDLEIIAVNDRSTDRTGQILDRLAAENPHLRVVHVRELPSGWLGKNHALHLGSQAADGEFILFTDADVHFDPTALRRAVRHCMARRLDFLTLYPECILHGFWETLSVTFFGFAFVMKFRPWKVADPRSKAYVGIGAFNLVRADAYRRMGGHIALPMEVADDVKLGKKMKESGARAECGVAGSLIRVRWVEGLRGIVVGLTKNMFAGFEFRVPMAVGGIAGVFLLTVLPVIGLAVGDAVARAMCVGALLCMTLLVRLVAPAQKVSPLYGLAFPLAGLVIIYIILRSMFFTFRQGGVIWRGTHYSLEELRRGVV